MPIIKRSFFVKCRGNECFELASILQEKIPSLDTVEINIGEDGLRITMYGYKSDIKRAWEVIKNTVKTYRAGIIEVGKGIKKYDVSYLVERTKQTFPPILLSEILRHMGYTVEVSEDKTSILTSADEDTIIDTIRKMNDVAMEIRFKARGTVTKYFIIASSILTGKPPETVLAEATAYGILGQENEKYRLKKEWRQALEEYLKKQ